MAKQLYSIEEGAQMCGVSRAKFCSLLAEGSVRSVKIGKRRLISDDAISDFIAKLESENGAA